MTNLELVAMTSWTASPTRTFLNELLNLPRGISKQVPRKVEVLEQDPISAHGGAKKLKDYENVYRVRIGDYRLFYTFGHGLVKLLSIRKRDERTYNLDLPEFETPDIPPNAKILEPQIASPVAISIETAANQVDVASTGGSITVLPYRLTETLLFQWQIPRDFWTELLNIQNAEALLDLPMPSSFLERILDNLFPRPLEEIKTQPDYLLKEPDDLQRFVEGALSDFLLKLDPEQEKLRDFGGIGPILVKGVPGTGKSTLALHRVAKLCEAGYSPILFTTYTQALVRYSEQLLEQLLGRPPQALGVEVVTVDALTTRYYGQVFDKPKFVKSEECIAYLKKAMQTAAIPAKNTFERNVYRQALERLGTAYLLEEIQDVIDGWGISTLDEYLATERKGRGLALKASLREALWAVYQTWQKLLAQAGQITWEQLRRKALDVVTQLTTKPYQAIVVDEAQDLSPVALRFLLALVPSFEGVYLTADASQSLYQRGFSWKQVHTDLKVTGRSLLLKRNYRNTAQIASACASILNGTEAGDAESLFQAPSPYQGNIPTVLLSDDFDQEAMMMRDFFLKSAQQFRLPLHGGAILCPDQSVGQAVAARMSHLGIKAEFVSGKKIDINAPYIKVLTLHSAKGLEFPFVTVVGLRNGRFPQIAADLPTEEVPEVLKQQRRLFYVGCSRAMRALMVCGSQAKPSPFLDTLRSPYWQTQDSL